MRRRVALDKDCQKNLLVFRVAFTPLSCESRLSSRRILVYRNGSYHSHNLTSRMTSYHVLLDVTRHGHGSSYQSLRPYQHRGRNLPTRYVCAEMPGDVGCCHQDTCCLISVKCDDCSSYTSSSPRQPHRCRHLRLGPKQPIPTESFNLPFGHAHQEARLVRRSDWSLYRLRSFSRNSTASMRKRLTELVFYGEQGA
ncbi:hypothetical protein EV421DRAFT_513214 [Armillaria borealis]|uniref:Uncharacterized protein n=1 Tax=Armillaria borealis TaxID=47425 RepID=A0AA39JKW5_9AGAR|nr:hypothetical protein EV421DRAFT_513214 [Armillaria borealis]